MILLKENQYKKIEKEFFTYLKIYLKEQFSFSYEDLKNTLKLLVSQRFINLYFDWNYDFEILEEFKLSLEMSREEDLRSNINILVKKFSLD